MSRKLGLLVLLIVAAGVQCGLAWRQQIWADEIFSLAMATGHSLEQPAAAADPARGDFVETTEPVRAAELARYAQWERGTSNVAAVVRAVFLSDTSPPLYYVLLHGWVAVFGAGDVALRALSIVFALVCVPLVFWLGRKLGGYRAGWLAAAFFVAAPLAGYYATEGRMYSLLWLCTLVLAVATVWIHEGRAGGWAHAAWITASAAGLLTHYYFVFPWAAAIAFLWLRPGAGRRRGLVLRVALALILVAPWYANLPASLAAWRVTKDSVSLAPPGGYHHLRVVRLLLTEFFSGAGHFLWTDHHCAQAVACIVFAAGFGYAFWREPHEALAGIRLLPWLWLVAACAGPFAVDLVRHTLIAEYPRYASAALPAACLLGGWALAVWRPVPSIVAAAVIGASWAPQWASILLERSRCREPYRDLARHVSAYGRPDDLVLVHSIPSGAIGIARYADTPAGFAAWVGQLGQRQVPASLEALLRGRRRVLVVNVHAVGAPAPETDWLRPHAEALKTKRLGDGVIEEFRPIGGGTF